MNKTIVVILLLITLGFGALILFVLEDPLKKKREEKEERDQKRALAIKKVSYAKVFSLHFDSLGARLSEDTIFISALGGVDSILIPKYLPLKTGVTFALEKNSPSILLFRKNYTQFEFRISYNNKRFQGVAGLSPRFYLRDDSLEIKEGKVPVSTFEVERSSVRCLKGVSLGYLPSESEEKRLFVRLIGDDGCEDLLDGMWEEVLVEQL